MCGAYPGMTTALVVRELTARFERARSQHAAAGRSGGVTVFERLLRWLDEHGEKIAADPRVERQVSSRRGASARPNGR